MSGLAPTLPLRNGAEIPVLGLGTSPLQGPSQRLRSDSPRGRLPLIDTPRTTAMRMRSDKPSGTPVLIGPRSSSPRSSTAGGMASMASPGVRGEPEAAGGGLHRSHAGALAEPGPRSLRRCTAGPRGFSSGTPRHWHVELQAHHLQRVLDETGITPDVNQIQLSPYSTRKESRAYHAAHGIVTESYSPLGASSDELRNDPVITQIAKDHGKSPTQVVLRWHIQLGLVAIPRSNPGRSQRTSTSLTLS